MKPLVIGLDLDGVLAEFILAYTHLARNLFPGNAPEPHKTANTPTWGFVDEQVGFTHDMVSTVWEAIRASHKFWQSLDCLEPKETMKALAVLSGRSTVYALTSRPLTPTLMSQTTAWLRSVGLFAVSPILTNKKGLVCNLLGVRYFLDDNVDNIRGIEEFSMGTQCYVRKWKYNEGIFPPDQYVESVGEFLNRIQGGD